MAIIKCKMCGGDLILTEGQTVAECEYCGSRQTVPSADNEKKLALFARANRLRAACEFDKAAGIYESIVADFPEEAEAYWGLVLCKYGIEYVDDPATGKKVPTCHRSSFDSVMEDSDLEQALENADAIARKVYREEAKQIEEIRKGIIEVSGKEEPYDIFICYKETDENGERTIDSVIAQDVYDALTSKGYRVFFSRITLEDKLGQEYEPYIFAALNSAKVMLTVGTDYEYFNAVWVKNEWSRYLKLMASDKSKHLIPCYKGIDAYDMPKEFAKLQAQDMGKVGAMQDLLRGIEKILPKAAPVTVVRETVVTTSSAVPGVESLLRRGNLFLEDKDWQNADIYFGKVLDANPECAEAYLGKLLVEKSITKRSALRNCGESLDNSGNYQKAIRFGNEALRAELTDYNDTVNERLRRIEQEREEREIREFRAKLEQKEQRRQKLLQRRSQYALAQNVISIGERHIVGLKSDGTVVAAGNNYKGQCNVSHWQNCVAVSAGDSHTVGLKADGTVVAVGDNSYNQCNVDNLENIVAISAGTHSTIGLKADGTVVINGNIVRVWEDIVAISVGDYHTVGLKSDGTVVTIGDNNYRQCDVSYWYDIVEIGAGHGFTVGLKSDGTVEVTGMRAPYQGNQKRWQDIVAISVGATHYVGLKSDGTVVAAGDGDKSCVDLWKDIVAVSAGDAFTVGVKSDGTVVAAGNDDYVLREVRRWKLFNRAETLEHERKEKIAQKIAALEQKKETLQTELTNLKGLFTGKRRKEIEAELARIENDIKRLG